MNQESPKNEYPTAVSPEKDLLHELETRDFKELSIELYEAGFDTFLSDGVLKNIPVVRTLYTGIKAGIAVRDYMFAQKIATFLHQFRDMEVAERQKFFDSLSNSKKDKFASTVIMLLDRFVEIQKAELLGLIWRACIKGDITYELSFSLSQLVDSILLQDLPLLQKLFSFCREDNRKLFVKLSETDAVGLTSARLISYVPTGAIIGNQDFAYEEPDGTNLVRLTDYGWYLGLILKKYQ